MMANAKGSRPGRSSRPAEQGVEHLRIVPRIGPSKDLPMLYATGLLINFTGYEFYVSVVSAVPDPWQTGEKMNRDIEAKVLARYMFTPMQWVQVVKSVADQIEKLRSEGAPIPSDEDAS